MNSNEIMFTSFQAKYHAPTVTKPAEKKQPLFTLIGRYVLPVILLDTGIIGIVSFVYCVRMEIISLGCAVFLLYGPIFILLAVLHIGLGSRFSRRFILLYIAVVLFLVASLIYIVLMRLGILYGVDFFDAGVFILVTNFILLPVIHIGIVLWKLFVKKNGTQHYSR